MTNDLLKDLFSDPPSIEEVLDGATRQLMQSPEGRKRVLMDATKYLREQLQTGTNAEGPDEVLIPAPIANRLRIMLDILVEQAKAEVKAMETPQGMHHD